MFRKLYLVQDMCENLLESVHLYDLECDRKINMVLKLRDFEVCMNTELARIVY